MAIQTGTPDIGAFSRYKTFADVQREAENTALTQRAAQLDNASKANIYKTQVLSAAAGSGDSAIYQGALQHLAESGVDVSDVPTDIESGVKYTDAARLSQSPLGSLLNAGLKNQSNQIALSGLTGQITPAALSPSIPGLGKTSQPPIMAQPLNQGSVAIPPKPIDGIDPVVEISQNETPGALIQTPQPAAAAAQSLVFQRPPQNPNETNAAYQARVNQAFDAYKADPGYEAQKTAAIETAKLKVGKEDKSTIAKNTFEQISQNIDALKALSPEIPDQGVFLSPEQKAALSIRLKAIPGVGKYLGSSDPSDAIASYHEISEQQVINSLKQLVESGQIRGNQFIEKIISRGSLAPIDGTTTDEGRQKILDQIKGELRNSSINAQNQSAVLNGSQPQNYQPLPVSNSAAKSRAEFNSRNTLTTPNGISYKIIK